LVGGEPFGSLFEPFGSATSRMTVLCDAPATFAICRVDRPFAAGSGAAANRRTHDHNEAISEPY
jgi:hypothetical protein